VPRASVTGIFSSNSQFNTNRSDGFVIGLTSVIRSNIVNDLRYNYNNFKNDIEPDPASAPGSPEIRVIDGSGESWRSGTNYITPQITIQKRNQLRDDLSWQIGNHTLRFGMNYERTAISGQFAFAKPARIRLYGPAFTGATLATEEDFLNAPVRNISMGIGDDRLPYNTPGGATVNDRLQAYVTDSWKVTPRLTVNAGLAYRWDSNLWNYDLSRPAVVAPLFGRGTEPPPRDDNNFGPRVGFAWDALGDARTVVRGGFGLYYDTSLDGYRIFERADLGPPGAQILVGKEQLVSELLPGGDGEFDSEPGLKSGYITLRDLLPILAPLRAELEDRLARSTAPTSLESGVGVDGPLFSTEFEVPYSLHYTLGVQRELPHDVMLQADVTYRRSVHDILGYDANFADAVDRYGNSLAVIPPSTFSIENNGVTPVVVPYADSGGYSTYKALLVRVDKRFTHGWQFTASYALSRAEGFFYMQTTFDRHQDFGPAPSDRTHRFVFSSIYELPRVAGGSAWRRALDGWTVSTIWSAASGAPASVFLPGAEALNGYGDFTPYLPGTRAGSVGRDVGSLDELNALIRAYNANISSYAARFDENGLPVDPSGTRLRELATLPEGTPVGGDSVLSTDVRLSKRFSFDETVHLDLIAVVFNLFNVANLEGANTVLPTRNSVDAWNTNRHGRNPGHLDYFGVNPVLRPTSRQTGVFGSGGPRAFQFALKFVF
jgi:hypothetical protein